jgi:hypothetical protein
MKPNPRSGAAGEPRHMTRIVSKAAVTVVTATAALLAVPALASAAPLRAAAKHPSTVSVSASPRVTVAGKAVKLTATVKSANPAPTGSVTFWRGSTKLCSAKLSKKSAHCGTEFRTAGDYAVRGVYSGDAKHAGATGKVTVVVKKDTTVTKITSVSPDRVAAGHSAIVRVTVTSQVRGLAATGAVSVKPTDAGDTEKGYACTVTLKAASKGTGTCKITPPVPTYGTIEYVATYKGDGGHSGSKSGDHKVIVPDVTTTAVSFSGSEDTLTATVTNQAKSNISPSAGGTGTVTFSTGGTPVSAACTDVKLSYTMATGNTATCPYTPTGEAVTVTATYSGDTANLGSSGTVAVS